MAAPSIRNPQTWIRVRRNELRLLATDIGNLAVKLSHKWPTSGEGRRVKELMEQITKLVDRTQHQTDLASTYATISEAITYFDEMQSNPFYRNHISRLATKATNGAPVSLDDRVGVLVRKTEEDIDAFRQAAINAQPGPSDVLYKLVPLQRLGPIEFQFSDGVLGIKHQAAVSSASDKANVEQSRGSLLRDAADLIDRLETSNNLDNRIIGSLRQIITCVEDQRDSIVLGITNITLGLLANEFQTETSGLLSALLQAFHVNVSMYVAQQPDWVRYAENAAMVEYTAEDVSAVYEAGNRLVLQLKNIDQTVDPEVPRTIGWILEAIRNPRLAAKRSVFGAIRTVENFVTVIFRTFADVLTTSREASLKGLAKAVTPIVTTTLLMAAVDVAQSVSPTAAHVMQARWLDKAARLVREQLGGEKADD